MGLLSIDCRRDALRRIACRTARVQLLSDVHERGCDLGISLPLGSARRERIGRIARVGLVFVHIPKAAGMSISQALYGEQMKHASIRLLHHVANGKLAGLTSFAVLRDPVDRFLSAYRYARAGGSDVNDVAEPFRSLYRGFGSIDDAIDHVERACNPYQVDHIFRPQHWYVTDRFGRIAVDRLMRMDNLSQLSSLIPGFPAQALPRLNQSDGDRPVLGAHQRERLNRLYAADFALWRQSLDTLRFRRTGTRTGGTASSNALVSNPLPFPVQSPI
jgi:hypothetical protein